MTIKKNKYIILLAVLIFTINILFLNTYAQENSAKTIFLAGVYGTTISLNVVYNYNEYNIPEVVNYNLIQSFPSSVMTVFIKESISYEIVDSKIIFTVVGTWYGYGIGSTGYHQTYTVTIEN